jgi:hypothetical protein
VAIHKKPLSSCAISFMLLLLKPFSVVRLSVKCGNSCADAINKNAQHKKNRQAFMIYRYSVK